MAPQPWLRSAAGNLSLKGLSLGLDRACRLVVVVVAARLLGEAAFGRFVFASTVTAMLALGTDLGLGIWTTRALARDRSEGRHVVGLGLKLRALASIPYAVVVALVAIVAVHGETSVAVTLLGIAALLNAFVDHFGAALRGYERFKDEAELNATRALFTAAGALSALFVAHSLASLCAGLAGASLGAALRGLAKLRECVTALERPEDGLGDREPPTKGLPASMRADDAWVRTALRESLPIWFAGMLSLVYFKVDTLFLRWMAGDAELGAYGAAYKLFEGSMMAPSVLLAVSFPELARAYNDVTARRRLERHVAALLLVAGLLVATACLIGGPWLVRIIFGFGFERAVASLRVLALGLPLVYLNYGLTHFFVARNLGRITTWLALMMLVLNVTLDLALIPGGKGPGAAWATVLSEIALTACCLAALSRNAQRTNSLPAPGGAKRDRRAA